MSLSPKKAHVAVSILGVKGHNLELISSTFRTRISSPPHKCLRAMELKTDLKEYSLGENVLSADLDSSFHHEN